MNELFEWLSAIYFVLIVATIIVIWKAATILHLDLIHELINMINGR